MYTFFPDNYTSKIQLYLITFYVSKIVLCEYLIEWKFPLQKTKTCSFPNAKNYATSISWRFSQREVTIMMTKLLFTKHFFSYDISYNACMHMFDNISKRKSTKNRGRDLIISLIVLRNTNDNLEKKSVNLFTRYFTDISTFVAFFWSWCDYTRKSSERCQIIYQLYHKEKWYQNKDDPLLYRYSFSPWFSQMFFCSILPDMPRKETYRRRWERAC